MRTSLRRNDAALQSPASWQATRQPSLPDEELLARLRYGDSRALEVALQRYWSLVVDYVVRLTGSEDAAEDIAQRSFCQLWDRRAQWQSVGSLRALLCRVARNYAVSEYRRQLADTRSASVFLELSAPVSAASDALEVEQLRSALQREIARLPARRREIVVLRCVHDLSYKEIAEVMDIAHQTVANQLSKALATLRGSLDDVLD